MEHLEENGFTVITEPVENLAKVKDEYQIPVDLQSCHTAVVDGYLIEGHVPADEIRRLLAERPAVRGLAVPGMPIGSPGMESDEVAPEPYDILAFATGGSTSVWAEVRP